MMRNANFQPERRARREGRWTRLVLLSLGSSLFVLMGAGVVTGFSSSLIQENTSPGQRPAGAASEQVAGWLEGLLPKYLTNVVFLDVRLWQWLGLIVLVLLASAAAFLISKALAHLAQTFVRRTETTWAGPLRLAVAVLLFYAGSLFLRLPPAGQEALTVLCEIMAVLSVSWLLLRMADVLASLAQTRLEEKEQVGAATLIPMSRRVTKVFVVIIALLSLLQNLGFNISGLLAGLGVGGLAIALAAQKSFENLFGGLVVIADRPIKVGDFCRVGEHIGTVEDIGLRSSRIRTLDRTLLTIPNAEFSNARIESYTERDKMRLYAVLQVGYDTSPDQMRYLLVEIRRMLFAHPKTLPDPCRVRFVNLGAYSLDIEVFVFVQTRDWSEFLGVREDIYLRILDIVKKSGAYFAYPSQTLYLGRDSGRDLERTRQTEQTVEAWRATSELLLPEFPPETVKELDDTLDYPPAGSALRKSG